MSLGIADVADTLRRNPLFRRIGDDRLRIVALTGEVSRLRDAETLFRRGEEGDAAYVVLTGAVLVRIPIAGRDQTVARLGVGELFGEIAVLCDRPRTTAIVAEGETALLRLGGREVRALLAAFPELSLELIRSLADRLEATSMKLAEARSAAG